MEYINEFPDWDKVVDYFENGRIDRRFNNQFVKNGINYEELLHHESYRLWKLLNNMQ